MFQVTASDDQANPVKKDSPSGAWLHVLKCINDAKPVDERRAVVSVSGPGK
jgi:hypothetical protein